MTEEQIKKLSPEEKQIIIWEALGWKKWQLGPQSSKDIPYIWTPPHDPDVRSAVKELPKVDLNTFYVVEEWMIKKQKGAPDPRDQYYGIWTRYVVKLNKYHNFYGGSIHATAEEKGDCFIASIPF